MAQLFQVANWPRLPDDLRGTEHPEIEQYGAQAREWMRQLTHLLDETLQVGGGIVAESSDALSGYPYPPGAVIYADAEGVLAGGTDLTWDQATKALVATGTMEATVGFIGPQIGPSGDPDLLGLAANVLTVNGNVTLLTSRPSVALQTTGGTEYARFSSFVDSAAYVGFNAYYDGANFQRDDVASGATLVDIGQNTPFRLRYAAPAANPIAFTTLLNMTNAGQVQHVLGSAAVPSLSFLGRTTDGLYSSAAGFMGSTVHLHPDITNTLDLGQDTGPLWWRYLWSSQVAAGNCNSFQALVAPGGNITLGADKLGCSFIAPWDMTIVRCSAYAQVAPTGADIVFDIHKNGGTIWATQANRLKIVDGANSGNTSTFNVTALAQGDRLTFDVDGRGATIPGANVTVEITFIKQDLI